MKHVNTILPDYLNGKLDSVLRLEVERHLNVCLECRIEAERLSETLTTISQLVRTTLPHGYFTTVLPRVNQRLEGQRRFAWLKSPFVVRFVAPVVAVVILLGVLSRLPFQSESSNLAPDAITLDDLADLYVQQVESPLTGVGIEQLTVSILSDDVLERQLAEFFIADGEGTGFEEYPASSTEYLLESFSDQEVETLLQRLQERTM